MKKIVKPFLISFSILLLLVLGSAATMPKNYTIEQKTEILATPEVVFPLVADFSRWKEWSPWYDFEPNAFYETKGTMGEVGSSIRWHGRSVGRGTIVIDEISNQKKINMKFNFETPHKSEAFGVFTFEDHQNSTIVTWTNQGELEYPFGRIFGSFLKAMIEKDLSKGLEKLKVTAEKQNKQN